MPSSSRNSAPLPAAQVGSLEELVSLLREEPTGALASGDDARAVRAARWMLGGVAHSGAELVSGRTRDLAEKLRRLADADQRG